MYGWFPTTSLIKGVAVAFTTFKTSFGGLFKSGTRDSAPVAERYLNGLLQAERCNFAEMAAVVEDGCEQQFQHFITNSPWKHRPVLDKLAEAADRLVGGKPTSCLVIDESSFPKQGACSVGVARQWSGRLGKVDNCQVAVFGVLTDGQCHVPIDARLYLPKVWLDDPERCDAVGIPADSREMKSKSQLALEIVRTARAGGVRFEWSGYDAGYGKEPEFLRKLEADGEIFVADVHKTQRIWTEHPEITVSTSPRRHAPKMQASVPSVTVKHFADGLSAADWTRCKLRDSTRGKLEVDIATRRVWLWDGKEETPRCWHLIVRREVGSPKTVKYTLSNAPAGTPKLQLAQMQGQRYWVERTFEDAKGECGLGDYQAVRWLAWHHHVTMVMLAMLFIAEQRVAHLPVLDLLSPRDIVEILKETLPRKSEGMRSLVTRINLRHKQRRGSIESRFRSQAKTAPS
jgi:SRSO17 transposase